MSGSDGGPHASSDGKVLTQPRRVFDAQKEQSLSGVDYSRKGSIDEPIIELVAFINQQSDYFTLSSCSGRACLFEENQDVTHRKKGCKWLYTTHEKCDDEAVLDALMQSIGDASLKYEAFILHVQCYAIGDAQMMHAVAVSAGFRNSGISISTKGKIVVAVRSTHGLEVPLTHHGQLIVPSEYVHHVCNLTNKKLIENSRRIQTFFASLKTAILAKQRNSSKKEPTPRMKHKYDHICSIRPPNSGSVVISEDTDLEESLTNLFIS